MLCSQWCEKWKQFTCNTAMTSSTHISLRKSFLTHWCVSRFRKQDMVVANRQIACIQVSHQVNERVCRFRISNVTILIWLITVVNNANCASDYFAWEKSPWTLPVYLEEKFILPEPAVIKLFYDIRIGELIFKIAVRVRSVYCTQKWSIYVAMYIYFYCGLMALFTRGGYKRLSVISIV